MLVDTHCHPFDLVNHLPEAEDERRRLDIMCVSSASTLKEFEYCEGLAVKAKDSGAAPVLPCFAVHPAQKFAQRQAVSANLTVPAGDFGLDLLQTLASQKRLAAVGETGFDLYNDEFRANEKIQERLFIDHLAVALHYDLPVVIHARKAMHKIFAQTAALKKCRAVIFHSWPGTAGEGSALLMRGINAFFSFGSIVMLNHREAMRCCSVFPADHLLTETDAPFQPPRGRGFSRYADLPDILAAIAALRRNSGSECSDIYELEAVIEKNFRIAFS